MVNSNSVVIIGGTSGIGLETGQYLNKMGYNIILSGRRALNVHGIKTYQVDVRSEESVAGLFNVCLEKYDDINGLVYAAGITTKKKNIEDFDTSIWNSIIATNVTGLLLTLKYSYPFLKRNSGRVVIINSLAARRYSEFSGIEYTMSKAALSGLVRQLAFEWARDNILINSVYPGMTMTPMLMENVDKATLKEIEEKIPLGKIAKSAEIARAIDFLLSPKNTHMTGTGLDICGGEYLNG